MAYVYILENKVAECIKIGATTNHPNDRLLDISRMWNAIKGRCQICLSWRMLTNGRMPNHVLSMNHCRGSGELPFEYSSKLAKEQLVDLQGQIPWLNGSDLSYATKRIKNLEKILRNYQETPARLGSWAVRATFKIDFAYEIEKIIHQELAVYLDRTAPFGEVFNYPAEDAIESIESAIKKYNLQN